MNTIRLKISVLIAALLLASGCSIKLHERERDENKPGDVGTETNFKIRGPKAVIEHKF